MIKNHKLAEEIKNRLQGKYEIYSVYGFHEGIELLPLSPLEFANCFSHFDCVVTEFFHETCFSIKNNAKFISVDTEKIYLTYESKIRNLLGKLGLSDRYIDMTDCMDGEKMDLLIHKIEQNVSEASYPSFEEKLAPFVEETNRYLDSIRNDLSAR